VDLSHIISGADGDFWECPTGENRSFWFKNEVATMARPEYRPTSDESSRVEVLKAAGWTERDLAQLLGISRGTLRKHFGDELKNGRLRCRAEVVEALWRSASSAGNLAASKAWLRLCDDADAAERTKPEAPDAVAEPEPALRLVASAGSGGN
jgi:AraC-like DNA-binding protein